jgi:hypothetical protein
MHDTTQKRVMMVCGPYERPKFDLKLLCRDYIKANQETCSVKSVVEDQIGV